MADDDEIDILGDLSNNSCFVQNNQGIPSCSSLKDTDHPQWQVDSTEIPNWYDKNTKNKLRLNDPQQRVICDSDNIPNNNYGAVTTWTQAERKMLVAEMAKYGRNIKKISQIIKTKTEVEIQTLIDAEYGIHIEPSSYELGKYDDQEDIPGVVQEEIVADTNIKKTVVNLPKHPVWRKTYTKSKNSLQKSPDLVNNMSEKELFYDDNKVIGSTESIGSEVDITDVSKNFAKHQAKIKAERKIGNHRRKVSRNYDKGKRNRSKELLSPQGRQRKDSGLSDDSVKSPKMQIVLGSGQALPVSEGEEVIKIEKKKDSDPDSDIEVDIDIDSDSEGKSKRPKQVEVKPMVEEPVAVPLRKFEPLPRRQKKINLNGDGGYTIMHTEEGDLYEVGAEPKREKQPRKQPVHLIRCRVYNAEKPAPYEVNLAVSALIQMDFHAHTSRGEVMGLTGGVLATGDAAGPAVCVRAYRPARAAAAATHCDMEPVSQSRAASQLSSLGLSVCGWHHSHPSFPAAPSAQDLVSQRGLQAALEWELPLLGFITSQHWPPGRDATSYICIRIEEDESTPATPVGYQLRVRLTPDLTPESLPQCLHQLRQLVVNGDTSDVVVNSDNISDTGHSGSKDQLSVDMYRDVCPLAKMTYLEKCISSISHHMRSAGYAENDSITVQLIQGIRHIFR